MIATVPFLYRFQPNPNYFFRHTKQGLNSFFQSAGFLTKVLEQRGDGVMQMETVMILRASEVEEYEGRSMRGGRGIIMIGMGWLLLRYFCKKLPFFC